MISRCRFLIFLAEEMTFAANMAVMPYCTTIKSIGRIEYKSKLLKYHEYFHSAAHL